MAKIRPGIITIKGKIDDKVFTEGTRNGQQVKKAVKPGSKKEEEGLKKEYKRTPFLNKLAGEINRVIEMHDQQFKPGNFYQRLNTIFRKEPLNNRFLLLNHLKELEVNPKYPMSRLGDTGISVRITNKQIIVIVEAKSHPQLIKYKDNCYFFEALLLQWDASDNKPKTVVQTSDWIDMKKGAAGFEFPFTRSSKTVHWLLCLHKRMGIDKIQTDLVATKGMMIVGAGTFDKNDVAILQKREEEKKAVKILAKKEEKEVVRVKAKWVE